MRLQYSGTILHSPAQWLPRTRPVLSKLCGQTSDLFHSSILSLFLGMLKERAWQRRGEPGTGTCRIVSCTEGAAFMYRVGIPSHFGGLGKVWEGLPAYMVCVWGTVTVGLERCGLEMADGKGLGLRRYPGGGSAKGLI